MTAERQALLAELLREAQGATNAPTDAQARQTAAREESIMRKRACDITDEDREILRAGINRALREV